MYISQLYLHDFRNYSEVNISFSQNVNIIIGENAQGKTNLVEAIYILAFGKSFRTSLDKELIRMDEDFFHVSGEIIKSYLESKIDVKFNSKQKKEIKVNEVPLKKLGELMGTCNVVIFSPEDLQLIKGTPAIRRKYMDKSISQIYPKYYHLLVEYNKIIKQRNNLLKQFSMTQSKNDMIEIWNEQLSKIGAQIIIYRLEFLENLKKTAQKIHFEISDGKEDLRVEYESNYLPKNLDENQLYDRIYSGMLFELGEKIDHDIRRGYTSVGPHRDDLKFMINNIESKRFGSQGQVRTTALSLKLSEISIIEEALDESPILILDDVLSELDATRQNKLIQYIKKLQTFVTTTEINNIFDQTISDATIINITNGCIQNVVTRR